jgi:hypothetical protein
MVHGGEETRRFNHQPRGTNKYGDPNEWKIELVKQYAYKY